MCSQQWGYSCILEPGDYFENKILLRRGHINRVILTIATPLMINNLIRTLYNLDRRLYVAQLSAEDFAANRVYLAVEFLIYFLGMGISVETTALVASILWRENIEMRSVMQESDGNNVVLGFVMSVLGYFLAPLFVEVDGSRGEPSLANP